jgi:hypothetical protein
MHSALRFWLQNEKAEAAFVIHPEGELLFLKTGKNLR